MASLLSTHTANRNNNFNLIRFIAASLVIYSHSFALSLGSGETETLRQAVGLTWGTLAVDIFFISSGFLITSSYVARNNLIAFFWARALRIYPALIVAMIFCVFIVGLSVTNLSATEFLTNGQTWYYFFRNITLITGVEQHLPGVFTDNPYENSVNGSLWTLPYEIKMYFLVALVLYVVTVCGRHFERLNPAFVLMILAFLAVSLNIGNHFLKLPFPDKDFLHLFSMFFYGGALFLWKEKIVLSTKMAAVLAVLFFASAVDHSLFFIAYCLFLPYLILYIAYVPSGAILKFNNYGDYSYGIYIYAFPVQQILAMLFAGIGVITMTLSTFFIVLVLAACSWYLVEKPTLRMKNGYMKIEQWIRLISPTKKLTASKS